MKTTFFYILLACLPLFNMSTYAQTFSIGARGGISIPNLTAAGNENPINTGYSSRLGPEAGIFVEYKFCNLFSLQAMVEYSSQGGKKNGMQAFNTPDAISSMYPAGQAPAYLYANYKSEAKLNYLMIPVLAKFGWNIHKSPFRPYVDVGPFAAFLLSAHQVTSGYSPFYTSPAAQEAIPGGAQSFDHTENIQDQLYRFNFGVEGNVGLSYCLGHSVLFIEGGGNYGFLNIQKESQNGKNNTGAAIATVGYSYCFSHKDKGDAKTK